MNLVTPIGKIFLSIINKCFPPDHPLRKICNRNTLKISYSCMPSMGSAIARHNTKLLNDGKESVTSPTCNCRGGTLECPVNGQCLNQNVIYRAAVTTTHDNNSEFYTGLTSRSFKKDRVNIEQIRIMLKNKNCFERQTKMLIMTFRKKLGF